MTILIFALIALTVVALLVLVHRWLWIRLVRDTSRPGGGWRRAGTALAFALPLLSVAALVAGRAGVPFWLQRVVSWPGFMWLAVLLYLTLAMLIAEPLRALLLRRGNRAARLPGSGPGTPAPQSPEGLVGAAQASRGSAPDPAPQTPEGLDGMAAAGMGSGAEPRFREGAGRGTAPQAPAPAPAPATGPAPGPGAGAAGEATAPVGSQVDGTGSGEFGDAAGEVAVGVTRRTLIARAVGGAAAAAAVGTVGYGTYGVMRGPRVKRVQVPLAKLPRAAHGFRIAVVSDIHLGPILGRAHTQRIVDAVNRTQPDAIAIVGDLVDGTVHDLGPAAEPLRRLRARHGSYFVTGNHEYFSGAQPWVEHVRELGLTPLENARRALPHFDLAGVNDIAGEREGQGPDFQAALGDRDRARAAVLLAHQPVVIHDAVRHGVDLQLSGHTHGGQLWPGNYIAELANPTVAGLERYGDTQLYVSRGAGAWGPPVRVGAPSDITVVELASYQA
ncbi:metallophosphoesterase [Streptomyces sp. APSN-46.1]|uniref:metallophosphoesterase n=1 Tax=Streptomyces sp. APSN-46.1 TaxID=2929049 RepID=UPI001FB1A673|nr:metallophosphoesterase [Streptomyces sp. APSN-46.1]MCJ1677692.1 metallophosphoesterase [Streptomyces sp. APSN-46.1]